MYKPGGTCNTVHAVLKPKRKLQTTQHEGRGRRGTHIHNQTDTLQTFLAQVARGNVNAHWLDCRYAVPVMVGWRLDRPHASCFSPTQALKPAWSGPMVRRRARSKAPGPR